MTLSVVSLLLLIVLVFTIIRGAWLFALLIVVFIAVSNSMVAQDIKNYWHYLQTERVQL